VLVELRKDHPAFVRSKDCEVDVRNEACPYRPCFKLVFQETTDGRSGYFFYDCYCAGYRTGCPVPIPRAIRFKKIKTKKYTAYVNWRRAPTKPMTFVVPESVRAPIDIACARIHCSRAFLLTLLLRSLTEENIKNWIQEFGGKDGQE